MSIIIYIIFDLVHCKIFASTYWAIFLLEKMVTKDGEFKIKWYLGWEILGRISVELK